MGTVAHELASRRGQAQSGRHRCDQVAETVRAENWQRVDEREGLLGGCVRRASAMEGGKRSAGRRPYAAWY